MSSLKSHLSRRIHVKSLFLRIIRFGINNSVIHYRGSWYSSKKGIPTGGPDSGSIANIFVKWLFLTVLLYTPEVIRSNHSLCRKRYLDDIFMAWMGTARQFSQFVAALNVAGAPFGIQFTGSCSRKVEFLDTIVDITDGVVKTRLLVKPTDSPTYLNHNQQCLKLSPTASLDGLW